MHGMMAAAFKAPAFAIEQAEADKLAEAAANVARHYPTQVTQKQMDWANLVMAICLIYGTRLIAAMNTKKTKSTERVARTVHDPSLPGGSAVVEFPKP